MNPAAVDRYAFDEGTRRVMHVVGISEMMVRATAEDVLVTYSLGSCVGVALYDPATKIGGMIHCMMPCASIDPKSAMAEPGKFVDSGLSILLKKLVDRGARLSRLDVFVAGCASPINDNGYFKIGERNYAMARKVLWKHNVMITGEEVGGTIARSVYLHISSGRAFVRSNGEVREFPRY